MIGLCIITFFLCIIQISILLNIAVFQVTPNIVMILVIYIALFYGKTAMWVGFLTGLFLDLYSSSLGYNALVGTMVGYGVGSIGTRVYRETPILWMITLFVTSLFYETVIFASQKELSLFFFGRYIMPGALYTTIVGVIIFSILRRIKRKVK
ncbi:MAG: rod shape-determining protein MreD [bacterium]|nr:rod shape-determining protein MreD [bacterium]